MSIAWRGYKKPVSNDLVSAGGGSNCMRIGVQNLDSLQMKAILSAAAEVCKIFTLHEFRKKVTAQKWLSSCKTKDNYVQEIDGYEVLKLIDQKIADFSINPRKPWRAIAQTQRSETDIAYNRIAINPSRIQVWYSQDPCVRAELINTLAHEIMHIISSEIQDRGHGSDDCPDSRLVSYGIGHLVEEIWLKQNL